MLKACIIRTCLNKHEEKQVRNATETDVKKAQETGKLEENVMYNCYGWQVHGKRVRWLLEAFLKRETESTTVLAETAEGEIVDISLNDLRSISKGPSKQPKSPRRKPVKGTKPETLIPMSEDIELRVGDKVLLSDGTRVRISQVDGHDSTFPYKSDKGWFWYDNDGEAASPWEHNITHVIRPWTPPAPQYDPKDVAFNDLSRTAAREVYPVECKWKCQAQKDFEAGRWVGFSASSESSCPAWAKEENVEVILADGGHGWSTDETCIRVGTDWTWLHTEDECTIVAYRKAR
jgi:hypothetical protein